VGFTDTEAMVQIPWSLKNEIIKTLKKEIKMSKKLYSITIRGKQKSWCFNTFIDERYLEEWREDGIVIEEIINIIPLWVQQMGLTKPWCFLQDCFNFKNPFSKN
jgi:hypothetical protein